MTKLLHALSLAAALSATVRTAQVPAPPAFTLEQVLNDPFADNLIASPAGAAIAWTFNERGVRNMYLADGPAFDGRRLTPYQDDDGQALKVAYESSPISSVATWKSPVLLIHADDDRNVQFHQTVDLKRRLQERGVSVDEVVIPDDIHDFLLWRTWLTVTTATGEFFEKRFMNRASGSGPD
jgi:acetyl esterase/lipase